MRLQRFLCFGMKFGIHGFQLRVYHIGIYLGGGDVTVTHQLLDRTNIGTVLQKMHCEAVTQRMRRYFLFDVSRYLIMLQKLPEALSAHTNTADIYK